MTTATLFPGMDISKKVCTGCHRALPFEMFQVESNGKFHKQRRRANCKDCRHKQEKANRQTDRARSSLQVRLLKTNYGISAEQYAALLESQGNVCAICRKPETKIHVKNGKVLRLSVDHDHAVEELTGQVKIRGLLCQRCNIGLGSFEDNEKTILAAIAYLEQHQQGGDDA